MAKIKHINYLEITDNLFTLAKEVGIMHLYSNEESFDGHYFEIDGDKKLNFGSCSYMGLEMHPKLIESSCEYTKRYGTHFSVSRAYIKPKYMQDLEAMLSKMYNDYHTVVFSSTTTGHQCVIGTLINSRDLLICDQQVHFSIQYACRHAKISGTTMTMIRHSDYESLEEIIQSEYTKYDRIWYFSDSVYSMYGDLPDVNKLNELRNKYKKLHLYFDDAHGVSWYGKYGTGYIFNELGLDDRTILLTTLAKGFGSIGGVAIFTNHEMFRQVDIFGGSLSYSHPINPAAVGAALASGQLHMSAEFPSMQQELADLRSYCNKKLKELNIPNVSDDVTSIYFIGCGLPKATYNLANKIINDGFYINTATFPVVPSDKTGLRFTISRHVTIEDIEALCNCIKKNYPIALAEENENIEEIFERFNVLYEKEKWEANNKTESNEQLKYQLEYFQTIQEINENEWDFIFGNKGNFNHKGLQTTEQIFSNNHLPEQNWGFHYIIIKDDKHNIVCATHLTDGIYKDDMLQPIGVSEKIEALRKKDKYFLCSKTLAMGSMFSEGEHLYIVEKEKDILLKLLLNKIEEIKLKVNADVICLRDLDFDNSYYTKQLNNEGYIKVSMPNSNIIKHKNWDNIDSFVKKIESKRKRKAIRQEALKYEHLFKINIKNKIDNKHAKDYFKLFMNVKKRNLSFNYFDYPSKITEKLSQSDCYEFIEITLSEDNTNNNKEVIGVIWSFVGDTHYSPMLIGMNYDYLDSHHLYKQAVYQIINRANKLRKETIYLGFSADFEKSKYGAKVIKKAAYMKVYDTYNLELINYFSS